METTLSLVLISIVVAASITWTVKLLNFLWLNPRKLENFLRKQGLNGNPYRPFFGDLKEMTEVIKAEQKRSIKLSDDTSPHIFAYYHDILNKYGENSFLWFGPWPKLNIVDPELIKEILKKPEVFQKPLREIGKILTSGIVLLEGEEWAKRRKIINPAFHLHKLKNMVPTIGLSCSNMIHELKSKVSNSTNQDWSEIDVWPYLEDLTGDVISRTAFGSSHEQGTRIFQLQRERAKLTMQLLQLSFIPGWRYLPTELNKKVKAINNEIESLLGGIIDKRQKAMDSGQDVPREDLLGILMESNSRLVDEFGNKNKGMNIQEVIDECKLFYVAGSETTACLLVWTMILLCKHSEWQTQSRQEVVRVFGNSEPSLEGLNQLKIVTMILQEVLRLYPPFPRMTRASIETVKLGNLIIPAGVHLSLLVGLSHRDPEIWGDDANEFNPQRFSQGALCEEMKIQSSLISFSAGPRVCIGQNFAMIEAKMALARILQSFSFELSPSYLHAPFSVSTLQPQFGAPLIFRNLE